MSLGDPGRFWAASATSTLPRHPAPDLTDRTAFVTYVEVRGPRWQVPALLGGLAVFCVAYSVVSDTAPVVLWALAGTLALAAAGALLWDSRTRVGAYERAHTRFVEHGVLAQAYWTPLDVGHESFRPAAVLIDAGLPDERAARLRAAFAGWIAEVVADPGLAADVKAWFRVGHGVNTSEDLFGPDATGGYLTGPLALSHWKVLLPAGNSWRILDVRHPDEPAGAPPDITG